MLKNLQLVAFVDAGAAWTGLLPTTDNMSTTYTFPNIYSPPSNVTMTITVPNGLAVGYGPGLRTSLFGYFMRLDAAWNIQGLRKPIFYFALGTDF
jgi:hypothetical protein